MAIAMIGLIIVQTFWIKNSIKIKEQQFDQQVNQTLRNIVRTIQRKEVISNLSEKLNGSELGAHVYTSGIYSFDTVSKIKDAPM